VVSTIGPESLLWRWAGDKRIGFLGPTIGLLQVMHPAIGAAVVDHSDFFDDPYDRIFRSVPWILGVVYDGEDADATGRTVRDFHKGIKGVDSEGRRYHALHAETYWWAHATFQYMAEQVADRFDRHRLRTDEREQLYQEGVAWYRRYGMSERVVPPTRAAFQEVWDHYCGEVLEMNTAASRVLALIEAHDAPPKLPDEVAWVRPLVRTAPVRRLMYVPLRLAAIGGLPPVVRERFDIPWTRRDQAALDVIELTVRHTWRFMPWAWRWQPQARMAWQREAS
jgi:uncharacterized protein (DUF2236 family)